MCRLVAYLGSAVLLEEVLVKPENSIVMQSLHAKESAVRTNGDGFGVGWYAPDIDKFPALFRSISPAWSDNNLLSITSKIVSPCFFAHVRAASVGGTHTTNCHPFIRNEWMLMHNGQIHDFVAIKRHMRRLLDDDIYNWIQGETDSEHFFALFQQLARGLDLSDIATVALVLVATIGKCLELIREFGTAGASYFNVCVTDGERMVATRYSDSNDDTPESLYYQWAKDALTGRYSTLKRPGEHDYVMIASERLTSLKAEWKPVPANHVILVDRDKHIQIDRVQLKV
jgi:glutamine amidotransferase